MNATQLLAHFDRLAEAPDAVPRLRDLVLNLAVRGKLLETVDEFEPVSPAYFSESSSDEFPQNWRVLSFGQHFDIQGGTQPPKSSFISEPREGYVRLFQIRDLGERPVPTYISVAGNIRYCKAGEILVGRYGASVGKVFWAQDGAYNVAMAKVIYPETVYASRFVFLLLKSSFFQRRLTEVSRSAQAGFNKGDLAEIAFPLPPLPEQHRIVAKVDELMALCDQLEAAQQERERRRDRLTAASLQRLNQPAADTTPEAHREHARFHLHHLPRHTTRPEHIKAMRQTILNFAVHGWLVPQMQSEGSAASRLQEALASRLSSWETEIVTKAKATGKALAKDWQKKYLKPIHEIGLFELPPEWVWASTLEICVCVENGNTPSPHVMTDGGGEIPFLKVYNLTKTGELDFTIKPTFITRQVHEQKLQRSRILPGDVLINIVGPPLGKVSLVTDQYPEWNTNQAVVLFRPSDVLLPKYLMFCLLSDAVLTWITRLAQATVGQSNISVSKSRALPIPMPPLSEQHRIVAKVDELMALCDQLEAQLTTTQTDSRRLLEAVLEAALVPA